MYHTNYFVILLLIACYSRLDIVESTISRLQNGLKLSEQNPQTDNIIRQNYIEIEYKFDLLNKQVKFIRNRLYIIIVCLLLFIIMLVLEVISIYNTLKPYIYKIYI